MRADDSFRTTVAPFLQQYCVSCHGATKQEAGVRLDQVTTIEHGNRHLWTMIHEKLRTQAMPPKKSRQPSVVERKAMLATIEQQQRALGTNGTRRLNRRELAAALRDVTGVPLDYANGLPGDGTVAGFDTGAEGLQEASDGVAQWLLVTRRAVEGIRFLEATNEKHWSANLRESKDIRKAFDGWKPDGPTVKVQGIPRPNHGLLIEPRAVGDRDELSFTIPATQQDGILRVRVTVSAMKPFANIPAPRLWVRIGGKDLAYEEITGTLEQPQRFVYTIHLADAVVQAKGVTVQFSNKVEIPYSVEGFENEDKSNPKEPPPGGTGLFRPAFDRKALPPEKQPAPFIVLQEIELDRGVTSIWPPADWQADLGERRDDPATAERLLALWLTRAWRRPTTAAELAPFVKLYTQLRRDGLAFDPAVRGAMQSILMSAPFRYMVSPNHAEATHANFALASRLSFMLWGEPPDAELRRVAASGKLRDPATLDAQVERLLRDPRRQAFVRPFVMQWLELEQPITIAQDHIQKQDFRFGRYLKASLRDETIQYIDTVLAENRPAKELLASDWTLMNDTLARHYNYPPMEGGTLRKVTLRADDPRGGGLLGHAGIQSMLCWMGDNWVIYRGAWALRHILDQPPPPPPLEVPELNPAEGKNKGKPFRELLKQHQADTRCSVCHKSIDPVGFAFQNFDLSGRWRNVEHEHYARGELDGRIAWVGVGKTRPVDTTGQLPRGETFTTFGEFKQQLVKHYQDDFVRGMLKNLVVYATGRKPSIDDLAELTRLMDNAKANDYKLRDVLKALLRSRIVHETEPPSK